MTTKFKDFFGVNFEYSDKEEILLKIKALILAEQLTGAELDTLYSCWEGGFLSSGDTPSKYGRSLLVEKEILCQVCSKKEDYAFAVTYPLGYQVMKALPFVLGEETSNKI